MNIRKRMLIGVAALVAAAGTTALAQQNRDDEGFDRPLSKQERAAAEEAAASESFSQTVVVDGTKRYTVTDRNGKKTVEVDGEKLPKNRYRVDGDKVEILDEDGNVEKTIELPGTARARAFSAPPGQNVWRWQGNQGPALTIAQDDGNHPPVMIGITMGEPDEDDVEGVLIETVVGDSPAEKAGIKAGDILVKFDGKKVAGREALVEMLHKYKPGDKVDVQVKRGDESRAITVELAKYKRAQVFAQTIPGMALRGLNPLGGQQEALNKAQRELRAQIEKLNAARGDGEEARRQAVEALEEALQSLRAAADEAREGLFMGQDANGMPHLFEAPAPPRPPRAPQTTRAPQDDELRREMQEMRRQMEELRREMERQRRDDR